MKKIIAVFLAIMLLPTAVFAATISDAFEQAVYAAKEILDIPDEYDDFSGNRNGDKWYLSWSGENEELSVTISSDNKIYEYSLYDYSGWDESGLSLPGVDRNEVMDIADTFMKKVITGDETWAFREPRLTLSGDRDVYLDGRILKNGYPTDISLTLRINTDSKRVEYFYRSDCYTSYSSEPEKTEIVINAEKAKELFLQANPLKLVYAVINELDMARLVYKPVNDDRIAISVSDGAVLNIDSRYRGLYATDTAYIEKGGDYDGMAMADSDSMTELTEAEKAGISAYSNAKSVDELDAIARDIVEFGINENYVITDAYYYDNDGYISASLTYVNKLTDDEIKNRFGYSDDYIASMREQGGVWSDRKFISFDAINGYVSYLWTDRVGVRYNKETKSNWEDCAEAAKSLVEKCAPDIAAYLSDAHDGEGIGTDVSVRFNRTYNGYDFESNFVTVTYDANIGDVTGYDRVWDNGQEFTEPESELISDDGAALAYTDWMDLEIAYVSVPAKLVGDEAQCDMILGWNYTQGSGSFLMDAETGEVIGSGIANNAMEYDDIEGLPQEDKIIALASFGVGFYGGSFMPDNELSMYDLVSLIAQLDGLENTNQWSFEDLVNRVFYIGVPDYTEFESDAAATRGIMAEALTGIAGFGELSRLNGIIAVNFTDEVNDRYRAPLAVAVELGFMSVDENGAVNADSHLTRAEAAEIIFDYLNMD